MANFVVSSLPDYVENNKEVLLKNFALVGGDTRKRIGVQTGIKKDAFLNYLDLAPAYADGASCGWNPSGTATLTQKTISTATIKSDMAICPQTLRGKWAEYLVKTGADSQTLPFEEYVINGIINNVNKDIETMIWQGNTSKTTDGKLKWFDGFMKQMVNDSDVVTVGLNGNDTAYDAIMKVYMAMPEEVLERGGVIFVSPSVFRAYSAELVSRNLYHYGVDNAEVSEIFLPGTGVKVVKASGLALPYDTEDDFQPTFIVGTFAENLVFGTDLEGDAEELKVWYSEDNDEFRLKVRFVAGVAYHFGDMIVIAATDSSGLASPRNIAKSVAELADANHVYKTEAQ